jgi:hypothetical protein
MPTYDRIGLALMVVGFVLMVGDFVAAAIGLALGSWLGVALIVASLLVAVLMVIWMGNEP